PAFLTGLRTRVFSIFDPARKTFVPVTGESQDDTSSATGEAWTLVRQRIFEPSAAGANSLSELLKSARAAGVLVPSTALMVVENKSQWKMLELAEKKSTKAHEALAIQEPASTPEPGVVGLLVAAGGAWFAWRHFQRRSAVPAV
ncbi:MAG: hypothetical protein ACREKL_11665, partial [Chthoniobacterales bacterium]